jgi:hypothetical protein
MLDVINGLANGWVVTPVIDALARRRLFEALAQQPMRSTRWFSDTGPMKAIFAQRYCFYMS